LNSEASAFLGSAEIKSRDTTAQQILHFWYAAALRGRRRLGEEEEGEEEEGEEEEGEEEEEEEEEEDSHKVSNLVL
jgi:ribosomal protein L12E/L44/L45/RPP1/RPP2